MNSEITNVTKLATVATLKNDRPRQTGDVSNGSERLPEAVSQAKELTDTLVKPKVQPLRLEKQQETDPSEKKLDTVNSLVEKGNSMLQTINRNLEFQVDDSTKKVVVKIVDSNSGELIRQIPAEEVLNFIKKMQDLDNSHGLVIQERA